MDIIDFRSDTVTQPTPAMREAMYGAEVGDDVLGEDPTVRRLEEMAAAKLGKEAALFCASGTMSNLVAILTHTRGRGDEIIVGSRSHILLNEAGSASGLGSVHVRTVRNNEDGGLDANEVEAVLRPGGGFPRSALLCLENTHNSMGGMVLTPAQTDELCKFAHLRGIAVHLDGARLFNAAVYLGVPASVLAAEADSVSFCVSKGLSAPVGSLLAGSADFIAQARRYRRMVGGGMRQAGIIAAAGIVALETMIDRLTEDHENARALAVGLAAVPGLSLDPERVQTNIVMVETDDPATLSRRLREVGILASGSGPGRLRFVTHYGITREDVDEALRRIQGNSPRRPLRARR